MEENHSEDLRNVNEGDSVTIELAHPTNGRTYHEVLCAMREVHHADPRSGEIRETTLWSFNVGDKDLTVSITDGLKSSPDDPEFPLHKEASLGEIGKADGWVSMGYIESVEIHGKLEQQA